MSAAEEHGEDGDWLERRDHPLLNNVILDEIFKHLRGKDLKKCRLVCKTWNAITIPFTRNIFEVTIFGSTLMENFVELAHTNTLGTPYGRFHFSSFYITDRTGQDFVQLCIYGNTTKSIRCINMDDCTVEDLSTLLKSTPNLEMFETHSVIGSRGESVTTLFPAGTTRPRLVALKKLTVSDNKYEGRNPLCPTYLEELITAAENISSLDLTDGIPRGVTDPVEVIISGTLEVLRLIEKLGRESSIQELRIAYRNRDYTEYFELLHKMIQKPNGLKLKSFAYDVRNSEECPGLFQLIALFRDTLQSLRIVNKGSNSYDTFVQFQKMTRLRKLSVRCSQHFNSSRFVNLKQIFPVLEELELGLEFNRYRLDDFFQDSEPCPNVNSLVLQNVDLQIGGFNGVRAVFPNLTRLSVNVNNDGVLILQQIWSHMTRLKSLSISGQILIQSVDGLDSCLTGSPAETFQRIGDAFNDMEGVTSELERRDIILILMRQHCQLPSIANLIDLRSLTLDLGEQGDWDWHPPRYLTDLTGYLGLYSLKRLKHLSVSNCKFTKTCCEILTKDLGLESWSFKTSQSTEIIPSG